MTARRQTKDKDRQLARRRGSDFEKRLAARLGGYVWQGQDGDVEARGYRIECKHRTGLRFEDNFTFRDWIKQVAGYRAKWGAAKHWCLAITGGAQSGGEIFIVLPIEEFERLTELDEDRQLLERFHAKYPDYQERVVKVVEQMACDLAFQKANDDEEDE